MRIVQVSTSDKLGGAAIASWRLHEGMKTLGMNSRIVCRHPSSDSEQISKLSTPLFEAADLFHRSCVAPAQPPAATLFSLSPVSLPLLDHPWIAAADVVHLHWVAQFVAPEDIAGLCRAGKTVFWTFHDQWPYTGGCHYIGGTTRHEADWDGCAQIGPSMHGLARMEFQRKKQAFAGAPIHVIAPSRWMAEEAAASGVFHSARIHVIPNGINTTIFRAINQETESNDPEPKVKLLFGCQYLGEQRKGYRELRQAIALCMADRFFAQAVEEGRIQMITFGGIPDAGTDLEIPVIHLGMLSTEMEVADVLRGASAFICPTLEDNLPNVVMESLACGCPVLAFNTGGIPDMVSDGKNGLLAPKGDIGALAGLIKQFCLNDELRQRLREGTKDPNPGHRSLETQARRILELYEAASSARTAPSCATWEKCLPSVTVDAVILPHFGTEMTQMFVSEIAARRAELSQRVEALTGDLLLARNEVTQACKQLSETQDQLSQICQRADHLKQQLKEAAAAKTRQKLHHRELKIELSKAARKKRDLQLKVSNLKKENRKLKKSTFQRIRKYIIRRLKGSGTKPEVG